jgi:hypothetical protein
LKKEVSMKKQSTNEGISMIIVLWIMAILTVLTTATALMTRGDIASTINLIKRKGALQLAETGSDYFISMIPTIPTEVGIIEATVTADEFMPLESGGDTVAVHRVYMNDSRSFVIAPVPTNEPYPFSPGGGKGSYYVYEFTSGGLMGKAGEVESPQKVVDVAAGTWTPLGGLSAGGRRGHTMY